MSHDFEDSVLEEALRSDLPSADTERRLRRRLLAAGVAVGNGVATTTAAAGTAAGSAASGAAATGMIGKALGLSWGIKLGVAAAIAIPSVGLWLDRGEPVTNAPHAAVVAPPAPAAVPPTPAAVAAAAAPAIADSPASPEPLPERTAVRGPRPSAAEPATPAAVEAGAPHPSQSDFAALDQPPRAPEVGSTLADETRLLDAAFAALGKGERARAAQLIAEHESRYPSGLLKKERERAKARLSDLSRGE
ncbi:MAG TPA: hypothetical protein VHB79_11850 [Polyangiaceae bacterium]|nr:hypothetical protein [Polyangiaceae bacterium]